jgi:hypothetical protein
MMPPSPFDGAAAPSPRNQDRPAGEGARPPPLDDSSTGLPWPRTWRGVYLFVLGCFVGYVLLLSWLTHAFL